MVDEPRPHTALKGAKITGDIQEQISFSDANKTIGGYIEQEDVAADAVQVERNSMPIFTSSIKEQRAASTASTGVSNTNVPLEGDQHIEDDTDDDDFFYGDYISAKSVTTDRETSVIVNTSHSEQEKPSLKSSDTNPEIQEITDSSADEKELDEKHTQKRRISVTSIEDSPEKASPGGNHFTRSRTNKRSITANISLAAEDNEDEKFFEELQREAGRTTSTLKEGSPATAKRVYNIKFLSNLEGSLNDKINVKVKGKHAFSEILPIALKTLIKEYKVSKDLKPFYQPENVSLYRNGLKILNFMNCNSLHIPLNYEGEVSDVSMTLVSRDREQEYVKTLEQSRHATPDLSREETSPKIPGFSIEEFEKDLEGFESGESNNLLEDTPQTENNHGTIKIALMAQDNKKIYVNVRQTTTIAMLGEHYRTTKNLSSIERFKFVFDNEDLQLSTKIDDLDMEDGDIIEVVHQ